MRHAHFVHCGGSWKADRGLQSYVTGTVLCILMQSMRHEDAHRENGSFPFSYAYMPGMLWS